MICSWGLSYNLYADKLLGTKLFPNSVFEMRMLLILERLTIFSYHLTRRNRMVCYRRQPFWNSFGHSVRIAINIAVFIQCLTMIYN